jgi:hypothetical protein
MSATRVAPFYKDPIHKMLLCSGNTQNEIARSVVLNLVTSASETNQTIDSFHVLGGPSYVGDQPRPKKQGRQPLFLLAASKSCTMRD